jgi:hypothetical protein
LLCQELDDATSDATTGASDGNHQRVCHYLGSKEKTIAVISFPDGEDIDICFGQGEKGHLEVMMKFKI